MLSITKIFRFEAAHRISNYDGPCSNIHGHSYELQVTISGTLNHETDMLFDFKQLKRIVEEEIISKMDHALLLKKNNHTQLSDGLKVLLLDHEPTAEVMLSFMANKLITVIPEPIKLIRLRLYETESSFAEWTP